MEDEISRSQSEVNEIVTEDQRKKEENRKRQAEMVEARKCEAEASIALTTASTTPKHDQLQVQLYFLCQKCIMIGCCP